MPLNVSVSESFVSVPGGNYTVTFSLLDTTLNAVVAEVTSSQFTITSTSYAAFVPTPLVITIST